jgi:hypothetical protein
MTVCLAAFCNIGPQQHPYIVGAADRMITLRDVEFEPDQTKMIALASHTVLLMAGAVVVHAEAAPATMFQVAERLKKRENVLVREIAELYAKEYAKCRNRYTEGEILRPLSLDFDKYLDPNRPIPHEMQIDLKKQLQSYNIGAEAIVAGIDPTGAHLWKITNPGIAFCCDTECFASIGIGEWHSDSQFMVAGFNSRWSFVRTLLLAYTAKLHAEVNAGIGDKTDLFFIGKEGWRIVIPKHLRELRKIVSRRDAADKRAQDRAYSTATDFVLSVVADYQTPAAPTRQEVPVSALAVKT